MTAGQRDNGESKNESSKSVHRELTKAEKKVVKERWGAKKVKSRRK